MLEIATAVGVTALFLACIVLGGYIVFFPLVRTIAGGAQILRVYALRKFIKTDLDRALDSFISDLELGPTMADGGEKTEKARGDLPGKRHKKQP